MRVLVQGDRGTLVKYLQLALTRAGYRTEIDGIFGKRTCGALRAFLNTGVSCAVNGEVWRKLEPYLKGFQYGVIGPGDTIYGIAQRYRTQVEAILTANPSLRPENLQAGTVIVIPFHFPVVPENVETSSVLNAWIVEGLCARYPFLVSGSIGSSVMGRQIRSLQIGSGEKEVFYSASYHANESITTPLLLKFAEEYAAAYAAGGKLYGTSAAGLFEAFRLYLVPMVNPDGVDLVNGILREGESEGREYYRQAVRIAADYPQIPFPDGWKANISGVDLNLQFPAGWENAKRIKYLQGYVSPAPRDYVGPAPLTAPESAAVYEFTRSHDFSLILAYHTQGEVIYWKYLDYEPEGSLAIAEYFEKVSGYALELTPDVSGFAGYKDWFIQDYNRPGYTIEAGAGENPLPMELFEGIYEDNKGILLGGLTQLFERKTTVLRG